MADGHLARDGAAAARPALLGCPRAFEPNRGQTDPTVQFRAHTSNFAVFLTGDDAVLRLLRPLRKIKGPKTEHQVASESASVLRIHAIGASRHRAIRGEAPMRARVNYFMGGDPSKWHTDIPTYAQVSEHDVW